MIVSFQIRLHPKRKKNPSGEEISVPFTGTSNNVESALERKRRLARERKRKQRENERQVKESNALHPHRRTTEQTKMKFEACCDHGSAKIARKLCHPSQQGQSDTQSVVGISAESNNEKTAEERKRRLARERKRKQRENKRVESDINALLPLPFSNKTPKLESEACCGEVSVDKIDG